MRVVQGNGARLAGVLLIGIAGAACFIHFHLPVAALSGAMTAVAIAALMGLDCKLPDALRDLGLLLTSVGLGSTVSPEALAAIQRYPLSIVGLTICVILVVWVSQKILVTLYKWDQVSAFLASIPGALSVVMVLASEMGADVRKVAILQSIRLFVMMTLLPSLINATAVLHDVPVTETMPASSMALLFALSIAAGFWMEQRGMHAGLFMAGMVVSIAFHVTGVMKGVLPTPVTDSGMYLIGVYCGLRFAGSSLRSLAAMLVPSLVTVTAIILVSACCAYAVHLITGIRLAEVLVAFAPGALEAMVILGAALGLDTLYISTHHILRAFSLNAATPFFVPKQTS